jgi:hypothetical protein
MRQYLETWAEESEIPLLFIDGHDNAIVGIGRQFNNHAVIYNQKIVIENLQKFMNYEDASEYFEYNIVGAYVGENTPIFLDLDVENAV